jgi:hypothetical protein
MNIVRLRTIHSDDDYDSGYVILKGRLYGTARPGPQQTSLQSRSWFTNPSTPRKSNYICGVCQLALFPIMGYFVGRHCSLPSPEMRVCVPVSLHSFTGPRLHWHGHWHWHCSPAAACPQTACAGTTEHLLRAICQRFCFVFLGGGVGGWNSAG